MLTVVVLFNLKPGVKAGDYEAWARSTDLPIVNKLPSVREFRVLRSRGLLGSDAEAPYQYVEIIEIESVEALFADVGTPIMQRVASEFQAFAADPQFIVTGAL